MSNFDYGVIGNCRSAALISKYGSIDWCCLPDFDSPSVFAKILDKDRGGEFSVLVDDSYTITQKYIEKTNILCTQFFSDEGAFEILDFMPRYQTSDNTYFTPPEIYRYIRHLSGKPSFTINYNPRLNYAKSSVDHIIQPNYIRSESVDNPDDCLYLYSSLNYKDIIESKKITITTHYFILLSYYQKLIPIDVNRAYIEYQRTKVYWLNWDNRSKKFNLYNEVISRSLLVLKMLSFQRSGAVLAAITTSLPEVIGGKRNWDYRYCWLRDASMSIETLLNMGHSNASKRYLSFIKNILKSKSESFQIMYGIRGERELHEQTLDHLAGYQNSQPVRIGNEAYLQRQNDIYGYLMNVILQYYKYFPGTLDEIEEMWEVVQNIIHAVEKYWQVPDNGIWEIRKNVRHFILSKVMCWVAVDRAIQIAKLLDRKYFAERWLMLADMIQEDIYKHGWKEEIGAFAQSYESLDLDVSVLQMEEYGFISPHDEKFVKTVETIKKELFYKDLVFRYKHVDDFGIPSTAFIICSFWLVRALYQTGQKNEAKKIFEQLLSFRNHLGIYSEGMDFDSKHLLGNFPQAYSHLALINTAVLFSEEIKFSKFVRP